jgi:protein-disulfide isomerase
VNPDSAVRRGLQAAMRIADHAAWRISEHAHRDVMEPTRMIRMRTIALMAAMLAVAAPAGIARAADPAQQTVDRAAVERIVRDYLRENPEVVIEALEAFKKKQEQAELAEIEQAMTARRAEIHEDPGSPVGGNPKGDVTVVEFFDYRCGVCKSVHPMVSELIRSDGRIKLIYKEWPILGPDSIVAARAALASRKQGKYLPFHDALMEARGDLSESAILAIAGKVGLDVARLRRDMNDAEVGATLQRNYALAEALRINGTPSFIVGKELVRGARDLDSMRDLVARARKPQ